MNYNGAVLYVHGRGGSASESAHYEPLFPGYHVTGLDYESAVPWDAGHEIGEAAGRLVREYGELILVANSIGAFFSLCAGISGMVKTAFFISPVVDLERLVRDMMAAEGVSEEDLKNAGFVHTAFGEDLSWECLCWLRSHPVEWNVTTHILRGSLDTLVAPETVDVFAERHGADVTVMKGGEHWFHMEEQMRFLDRWIMDNIVEI